MQTVFSNLTIWLLVASYSLSAQADDVAELTEALSGIHSFSAEFSQQVHDETGTLIQESSGDISVNHPNQMYWFAREPYQHYVISNGEVVWQYDADLEQATRYRFDQRLNAVPALLLSGQSETIVAHYRVSKMPEKNAAKVFKLVPRNEQSLFDSLELLLAKGKIVGMNFTDSFQQVTEIQFRNTRTNETIEPSLFQFSPPDGVDVIIND